MSLQLTSPFRAKSIPPYEFVALLDAHTTSQQFSVNTSRAEVPQDGTLGIWDTHSYDQTLTLGPMPKAVMRFLSDVMLVTDPRTKVEWIRCSQGKECQEHWNEDHAYS